jgi:Gpi18-like mannosyltransferase
MLNWRGRFEATRAGRVVRSPAWVDAVLPTLLIHGLLLVFAIAAIIVFSPDSVAGSNWFGPWNHWDGPHFLEVAQHGYLSDPARIVLFPLFPFLIAIVSWILAPLTAAMVIALVSSLVAVTGLYFLVRLDSDRDTARLSVVAMNLFPTAFVFVAPYSEALFLAFVVWSLLLARRGNWAGAGIAGALAGATRLQGAFLFPALAIEYIIAKRVLQTRRIDRDAIWVVVVCLGPLSYLAINWIVFNDPMYFVSAQKFWFHVENVAPWVALPNLFNSAVNGTMNEGWLTVFVAPLVAFVILTLTAVWSVFSRASRPSYAVYTILTLASFVTLSWPISVPRYLLGVFPIFILGGTLGRKPWLASPLLAASVMLLGLFTTLFVLGHWAF